MLKIRNTKYEKKTKSNNELKCLLLGLKHDVSSMDGLPYLEQQYLLGRIEYMIYKSESNQVV